MTNKEIVDKAQYYAALVDVDWRLVVAIIEQESGFNVWAVRYEPEFKYILTADKFATMNRISTQTETQLQKMSIGLMQVMGAVYRELGFSENLAKCFDPSISIYYGCLKIKQLMGRYSSLSDVIASYNAGSPRRDSSGAYVNQHYVDSVLRYMLVSYD